MPAGDPTTSAQGCSLRRRPPATGDQPIEPTEFRSVLGQFGSGVVAVTATVDDEPAGMTCQSFVSLSLEPPLVAFCPARTSTTWPRIARAGRFCVNVLAADQVELCRQFARSGSDKFAGVIWRAGPDGSPVLDGVLAWIECELHDVLDGGDHHLVLGRVRHLARTGSQRAPLLFHASTFGRFAPLPPIAPPDAGPRAEGRTDAHRDRRR